MQTHYELFIVPPAPAIANINLDLELQPKKMDYEANMRKQIFNNSNWYLGFSSSKRGELANSLRLPNVYKSQIYKNEDPKGKRSIFMVINVICRLSIDL